MADLYEFTKIHSIADDAARHRLTFETDSGHHYWIGDTGAGKLDQALARKVAASEQVVFVAVEPTTGACRYVAHFTRDHVKEINAVKAPEAGLEVTLVLRPAILFLPDTHPEYAKIADKLARALKEQKLIWVGTFPGDPKIKDVHIPEKS